MFKTGSNIGISCLFRLFLPLILLVGVVLVLASLTLREFDPSLSISETEKVGSLEQLSQFHQKPTSNLKRAAAKQNSSTMGSFWKDVDLQEFPIPAIIEQKAKDVKINSARISVLNVDTFYREALPPSGVEASQQAILLLHGANFKSETWLNLNTINLLAAMGHRVVAVDLPGYGKTSASLPGDKGNYLKQLITTLQLNNLVIVSPSMSGKFSIPFLIRHSKDIDGYVPVAPVSTNDIVNEGHGITTPTLIIHGELDTNLGFTSRNHLSHLPNSQIVQLPNAKHPAYLDQPQMFHTLLYNFMKQIKNRKTK